MKSFYANTLPEKIGNLTILYEFDKHEYLRKPDLKVKVRCDCGTEFLVIVRKLATGKFTECYQCASKKSNVRYQR